MIRINLSTSAVSPDFSKSDKLENFDGLDGDAKTLQSQGALKLLLLFLVPAGLYFYESQNIPELSAALNTKRAQVQALAAKNEQAKNAVGEIRKFKEDQAKLQRQIDTLDGLQKERLKEVKILDNLQKDIPEKVWMTRIAFQENSLMLSGISANDIDFTNFMESLSKSVFLKDVNLVKSSEQATERGQVKRFEIISGIERALSAVSGVKK